VPAISFAEYRPHPADIREQGIRVDESSRLDIFERPTRGVPGASISKSASADVEIWHRLFVQIRIVHRGRVPTGNSEVVGSSVSIITPRSSFVFERG